MDPRKLLVGCVLSRDEHDSSAPASAHAADSYVGFEAQVKGRQHSSFGYTRDVPRLREGGPAGWNQIAGMKVQERRRKVPILSLR